MKIFFDFKLNILKIHLIVILENVYNMSNL